MLNNIKYSKKYWVISVVLALIGLFLMYVGMGKAFESAFYPEMVTSATSYDEDCVEQGNEYDDEDPSDDCITESYGTVTYEDGTSERVEDPDAWVEARLAEVETENGTGSQVYFYSAMAAFIMSIVVFIFSFAGFASRVINNKRYK